VAEGRFNTVAILDAIPAGEANTARRLREQLRDIAEYHVDGLHVRHYRVETPDDLKAALSILQADAVNRDVKPWIHLEGHGLQDESGFLTANGNIFSWQALKTDIAPVNTATNLNVVLVLATCYGGSFVRVIDTTDRAPILGLVGPMFELTAHDMEVDFGAFYQELFLGESLATAVEKLTARGGQNLYYRETAESFFFAAWANYKKNYCSKQALHKRARKLYRRAKGTEGKRTPSVGSIKRLMVSREPELFERFRDTYFLYDMYAENRERFPVRYRDVEEYANKVLQATADRGA
jgi:hypothetical protein